MDFYYYLAYVSVFFSAYLYLFYILEKKFFLDNVMKLATSGKPLTMLCEEAFYKSIVASLKGYVDILIQPFLIVLSMNALLETTHHFFGCNKSFKMRVSSVAETYFQLISAAILYAMFVLYPVKATATHPLAFGLLFAAIVEKLIVFAHRLAKICFDKVPGWLHFMR